MMNVDTIKVSNTEVCIVIGLYKIIMLYRLDTFLRFRLVSDEL